MSSNSLLSAASSIRRDTRAEWIDALRGFALLGILLYNIEVFSGIAFRGMSPNSESVAAALDPAFRFLGHWLIQGKLYSLFAFLFGLGIALQLQGARSSEHRNRRRAIRRMGWLLVIGLAHAFFLWFGDILTVYALLGFLLIVAWHLSTRMLLHASIALLCSPVVIYLLFMAFGPSDPLAVDPARLPARDGILGAIQAMSTGSYTDVVQANVSLYPGGWIRRSAHLALPRILGMLLLGAWAARVGFPRLGEPQVTLLRAWLGCGAAFGLPLSLAFAIAGGNQQMFPVGPYGLFVVALATVSIPLLSLGYVAAFGLYWRPGRTRALLVSAGRTSMSQYLGQSLICILLFYGFGLGLFGRVSYGLSTLLAMVVFLCMAAMSHLWLQFFRQGPVEMLWRRLSNGPSGELCSRAE